VSAALRLSSDCRAKQHRAPPCACARAAQQPCSGWLLLAQPPQKAPARGPFALPRSPSGGERLDEGSCQQLVVPLEALDRFGGLIVDYRGSVPACAGFEVLESARKMVHGLMVGAWMGERPGLRGTLGAAGRCGGSAASPPPQLRLCRPPPLAPGRR
jgi:hypothetical protein